MTNSPNPAPSTGGGHKGFIVALVVLLVLGLGCWAGIYAYIHFTTESVEPTTQEMLQKSINQEKKRIADEQAKREAAMQREAQTAMQPQTRDSHGTPAQPGGEPLTAVKLPADFPSDIPLNDAMTATEAESDPAKKTGAVVFTGAAKTTDLSDFYAKQMAAKGWTVESNNTFGANIIQSYTKDDRKVAITITTDENSRTRAAVGYGPK